MLEQSIASDIKNFIENTKKHIEVVSVNDEKKSVTIKLKSST